MTRKFEGEQNLKQIIFKDYLEDQDRKIKDFDKNIEKPNSVKEEKKYNPLKNNYKRRTILYLDIKQYRKLKRMAKKMKTTISNITRAVLEEFLLKVKE